MNIQYHRLVFHVLNKRKEPFASSQKQQLSKIAQAFFLDVYVLEYIYIQSKIAILNTG